MVTQASELYLFGKLLTPAPNQQLRTQKSPWNLDVIK